MLPAWPTIIDWLNTAFGCKTEKCRDEFSSCVYVSCRKMFLHGKQQFSSESVRCMYHHHRRFSFFGCDDFIFVVVIIVRVPGETHTEKLLVHVEKTFVIELFFLLHLSLNVIIKSCSFTVSRFSVYCCYLNGCLYINWYLCTCFCCCFIVTKQNGVEQLDTIQPIQLE